MDHEIGKTQSETSTQEGPDSFDSLQAEAKSTPDLRASAEHTEQDSGIATPKFSKLSNQPRDARQARLIASIEILNSNITSTESQLSVKTQELTQLQSFQHPQELKDDLGKAALAHAQVIANRNISLIKRYNEIKDIAMGMLSLIAEKEGKRLAEVMEERGVSDKD